MHYGGLCRNPVPDLVIPEADFALIKVDFTTHANAAFLEGRDGFPFLQVSDRVLDEGTRCYSFGYPLSGAVVVHQSSVLAAGAVELQPRATSMTVSSTSTARRHPKQTLTVACWCGFGAASRGIQGFQRFEFRNGLCGRTVYRVPEFKLVLQAEPKLGTRAKDAPKPQRGVRGNAASSIQNFVQPPTRDADGVGKLLLRCLALLDDVAQVVAGCQRAMLRKLVKVHDLFVLVVKFATLYTHRPSLLPLESDAIAALDPKLTDAA
jgi:hypothetical protein